MGTKNNPGDFDCYTRAEPDEPMFVLLARDPLAPELVREWAVQHHDQRGAGDLLNDKEREAMACADAMEKWRTRGS